MWTTIRHAAASCVLQPRRRYDFLAQMLTGQRDTTRIDPVLVLAHAAACSWPAAISSRSQSRTTKAGPCASLHGPGSQCDDTYPGPFGDPSIITLSYVKGLITRPPSCRWDRSAPLPIACPCLWDGQSGNTGRWKQTPVDRMTMLACRDRLSLATHLCAPSSPSHPTGSKAPQMPAPCCGGPLPVVREVRLTIMANPDAQVLAFT